MQKQLKELWGRALTDKKNALYPIEYDYSEWGNQ